MGLRAVRQRIADEAKGCHVISLVSAPGAVSPDFVSVGGRSDAMLRRGDVMSRQRMLMLLAAIFAVVVLAAVRDLVWR
jgi:hypothetical protein